MSDGSLSQDEIDALLQGTDDATGYDMVGGADFQPDTGSVGSLSQQEVSAFLDLINSSSANIGDALETMISRAIKLSNPRVESVDLTTLQNQLSDDIVEVRMDYEAGVVGEHYYMLEEQMAQVIGGLMMGQEGSELTDASLSAVSEAMNIISGNSSNTIGTKIKKDLKPAPPTIEKKNKMMLSLSPQAEYVKVIYDFSIDGYPPSNLVEIYSLNVVKDIVSTIVPATNENLVAAGMPGQMGGAQNTMMGQPNMMGQQNNMQPNMGNQQNMQQGGMNMQQGGMNMQQGMNMGGAPMMGQPNMMMGGMQQAPMYNVQFSDLNQSNIEGQSGNINLLMDVNMELTVELGRTKKSIKDILGMGEGTVIELDKLAGEPVDVLVNGKLIAKGEVVVIDENFGVRVTEIVNPLERIAEWS